MRHPGGPLLILAGPGSGKTRVICHRIAWLVRSGSVAARHILGITFTNKAANEMRERVADLIGNRGPTTTQAGALDFDDLLLRAVRLLGEHETVRAKYAARYRHVLIDEYQDTNLAQYQLTRLLARDHRNVCAVGDPDQAIYGWRGADSGNIRSFEEDFRGHTVVNLERNYRSSGNIVNAAAALIDHNRERADKTLWTSRGPGAPIGRLRAKTDHAEPAAITDIVRNEPPETRQTAVLYRTNAQSRLVEDMLRRAEIPYHIVGNIRFYERKEIKDALAYLKVVVNPHDDVSLRRIINAPPRGIGPRSIEKAAGPAKGAGATRTLFKAAGRTAGEPASLWTRLDEGCTLGRLKGRALEKMLDLTGRIRRMREDAADTDIGEIVRNTISRSGYLARLENEGTDEAMDRLDNLMELVAAADDYQHAAERPTLAEFVNRQSLLSEADEGDGPNDAQVWLMTLHAAKGLEFPTVVIAGVEEGLLPHQRSLDGDEAAIEEERRLFYVGITRAMDRLVITTAESRRRGNDARALPESRFLDEIGLGDTWDDDTPDDQIP